MSPNALGPQACQQSSYVAEKCCSQSSNKIFLSVLIDTGEILFAAATTDFFYVIAFEMGFPTCETTRSCPDSLTSFCPRRFLLVASVLAVIDISCIQGRVVYNPWTLGARILRFSEISALREAWKSQLDLPEYCRVDLVELSQLHHRDHQPGTFQV